MATSSAKKRVLVMLPVLDLGGAEKQGLYCAKSLKESGNYEVEVWALANGSGTLIPILIQSQITYRDTEIGFDVFRNRWKRLTAYYQFWMMLISGKFDAIIPFTYHCNILCNTIFRLAGIQKCLWFQIAMEFHLPLTIWERIARFMKPIYAANSKAAGGFIAEKHAINPINVSFIPNPFELVPPKKSKKEWLDQLNLSENDILMVMVANYFPEKDHASLLQAMPKLLVVYPNLKLLFAGGLVPENRVNALKAQAFDLNLVEKVKFIGSTNDIAGLLLTCHIGILNSRSEGSPNSLIEYMGYGLPVIASSIPAIVELLGADYPYLFQVDDSTDFTTKAENLLKSLGKVDNLVNENKQIISKTYSVSSNFQAFNQLLEK
jgi:glycosyltransferase involved in cell wall biosynthesis